MKPLAPNTMIQDRYLVVHIIGKGGMGEVYLAVDQRLGSAVALKRTFFSDSEALGSAFEREAKILARLRHPVLPKVSDHFMDNGDQYLVMEHIAGDDLSKRLETADKQFPVSWVMFWADQLLDALSYLHSHEPPIIHRDIKPQNLKLTDENHIVLLDFGLSKDTGFNASEPGKSGSVVGYTPHFAPMEQIRGTGTNPRSDIYSLSATLYQLISNTVPADALSRADSMLSRQTDPILPLSQLNPEVSPAVSNVILKGLEVSQEKRFATASEMQKALRSAYSQIKEGMAAETLVFNSSDITANDIHLTTPPRNEGAPIAPSEMATRTPTFQPETSSNQSVPMLDPPIDATLQINPVETPEVVRQGELQTEIFLASDGIADSGTAATPPSPFADDVSDNSSYENLPYGSSANTAPNPAESVAAAIVSSEAPVTPEFFTAPAVHVVTPEPDPPPVQPATSPELSAKPAVAKKKSGSKAFLILGGLAAVFIAILALGGGGWYYYTNYYNKTGVKPLPTPTPVPSPTVEATPSPEPTIESNSNVSNSGSTNTNSNTNSDADLTPTPEPVSTPVTGSRPTQQPVTPRDTPARPVKTPGAKPTPKQKPSNDRTVILQ